uniref:ATP-dependent DNA helicase n=1 Tax=Cajanus cajan TaxID=3821 RepID=A0A151R3T2_CAJCA|nr:putative ATP-dependent helicase YHR031C family [Cajanus cajan]
MCCSGGKVNFTQYNATQELLDIFLDSTSEGKHFRKHIRSYNHVLSFTSLGVHLDKNVGPNGCGIYSFRAQGSIYHNIGGFYPNEGCRPRFLQLYIYDADHELQNRMLENPQLHQSIVSKLQQILHQCNPFVHVFKQLALRSNVHECSLLIKERPDNQPQYHLPTASQVAAIIVGGDTESLSRGRDINLLSHDGNLVNIQETVGYYDPLQYPLLLPFGTYGWDFNIKDDKGQNISCREYYSYILQIRPNDQSTLLKSGRLLQQYVVDNYVKIESGRLRWIRNHQNNIRAEVYQGLQDALHEGETIGENIGKRTILPSSFIGSRRDLTQRYEDEMAGKSDIFLIMTCNPSWSEISSQLGPYQTPQDRPDLLTRIFRSKFEQLKEDVINKGVVGKVKNYDSVVRAEIPKFEDEPQLHEVVLNHMIYGPCGTLNPNSPCMKNGQCKKMYLKECLVEASSLRMPYALRSLFVTILIFCEPTNVRQLLDDFYLYMMEDYPSTSVAATTSFINILLQDLNDLLIQHGKQITDYDLPTITMENTHSSLMPRVIQEELSIQVDNEDVESVIKLNNDQLIAFNAITEVINNKQSQVFFVDGPGGTGKIFLYRTIIANVRSKGQIVLATASSGIVATLLTGGRTAHSRFKIPINVEADSFCSISKQFDLAKLIRETTTIIWDEAPMTNRYALEALDITLKDILDCNAPFGGKIMILGGDFRQVLPVVPKGTKAQMIYVCIVKSHLWPMTKVLHLRQNMQSLQDPNFAKYLQNI